jgi:hypothetical protein
MVKYFLFLTSLIFLSVGCGHESKITNDVKAEKLAEMYGDGKYVTKDLVFPLENSVLAFDNPLPGFGPIAGGMLKLVGDIFAKNTKMGALNMSFTQPIPEIPTEIIPSVKLKRFFFYMKPKKQKRRLINEWFRWATRYVLGMGDDTFNFLDKLAVRLSTTAVEKDMSLTSLMTSTPNKFEVENIMKVFKGNFRESVIDNESARDLILLKYDKKKRKKDTANTDYGKIHYLETSGDPYEIKKFFLNETNFSGYFKKILILEQALFIELDKDPVSDEIFKDIMVTNAERIEELGVYFIDTCTEHSCLEIKVPNVNMIPIATKGNAIKLEAILRADAVPESFKLKGFVEFEVKVDPLI